MANIFIAVLFAVFFFFPLMTYIIFWYDTGNSAYRDELANESGGRTASWILKGFLSCILSHIIIISSCPLAFNPRSLPQCQCMDFLQVVAETRRISKSIFVQL